jgi:hypothetical protein
MRFILPSTTGRESGEFGQKRQRLGHADLILSFSMTKTKVMKILILILMLNQILEPH